MASPKPPSSATSRQKSSKGAEHFTPRPYQVELLDKATQRNAIIQLGTGAGKTFIAAALIKEYGVQLQGAWKDGGRRAFFIVDKIALVEQQAQQIETHTPLRVGRLHGALAGDHLAKIVEICEENEVIVLTAQLLVDAIQHAVVKLEQAALLVFDECHHAMGPAHPFRQIMDRYREAPEEKRGRVLGLTASLINDQTSPAQLEQKLLRLESALCAQIETACDLLSVAKYGARPLEALVICEDFDAPKASPKLKTVLDYLDFVFDFCRSPHFHRDFDVDPTKSILETIAKTRSVIRQLGAWAGYRWAILWEKEMRRSAKQQLLGEKQVNFVTMGATAMAVVKRQLEGQVSSARSAAKLLEASGMTEKSKMGRLLEVLKRACEDAAKPSGQQLSAIIFVNQRSVAYALHLFLRAVAKYEPRVFGAVKSDFVVGFSGTSFNSEQAQSQLKRQEEVMKRFRRSDLSVLVATSVLEEGVDVKHCNLVIKFDRPDSFRSYVQSRGRARRPGARYVVLAEKTDEAVAKLDLNNYAAIEKILLSRYQTVHNPLTWELATEETQLEKMVLEDADARVPPYVTSLGARVSLTTAIPLVNRYCAKLPSDIFTRLVPQSHLEPVIENGVLLGYKAELWLPINSPVKEVMRVEQPMPTKRLAQQAVALYACQRLHELGELNNNLLPVGKEQISKLWPLEECDEYTPGRSQPGSQHRRQMYDKKTATILNRAIPKLGEPCHVYALVMNMTQPAPADQNPKARVYTNPRDHEFLFGFLSSELLPPIPAFPAYLRQGDMLVEIRRAHSTFTLDEPTLIKIQKFHHYIFGNVLQLGRTNLALRMGAACPANTLVVPLTKITGADGSPDYTVAMQHVESVVANPDQIFQIPNEEERSRFKFDATRYCGAIVMRWYVEQQGFFHVADILRDMSPASPFPDAGYASFNEYFAKKYSITIYDQQQPLLDVDYTSHRLNLLLPRARSRRHHQHGQAQSQNSASVDGGKSAPLPASQRQIFVPELCLVHPISSQLWHAISALPSLFHRINQLLLADELRATIVKEAFEVPDAEKVDWDRRWPRLTYPATVEERERETVSTLNQLKARNKSTVTNETSGASGGEDRSRNEEEGDGDPNFEIGVWDPELAATLVDADGRTGAGLVDGVENIVTSGAAAALGLGGCRLIEKGGDLSDDDDDDDDYDGDDGGNAMGRTKQTKRAAQNGAPNQDAAGSEDEEDDEEEAAPILMDFMESIKRRTDFAAPRANIPVVGWGDEPSTSGQQQDDDHFVLVGNQKTVDMAALMTDLRAELPLVMPVKDNKGRTLDGARQKEHPVLSAEEAEAAALADDREPAPDGETVRLEDVEDGKVGENDDAASSATGLASMNAELEQLERGDQTRERRDREAMRAAREKTNWGLMDVAKSEFANAEAERLTGIFGAPRSAEAERRGASPTILLAALTASQAADGVNMERLETIGDSFLKLAVTDFLYHQLTDQHEGRLSFLRSKEVSNFNLYRLGKRLALPGTLFVAKFEAMDAWLPPCYVPADDFRGPKNEEAELVDARVAAELDESLVEDEDNNAKEEGANSKKKEDPVVTGWDETDGVAGGGQKTTTTATAKKDKKGGKKKDEEDEEVDAKEKRVETIEFPKRSAADAKRDEVSPIPLNVYTQHYMSDKTVADAIEALIGAHLVELGPGAALRMMNWLGIRVQIEEPRFQDPLLHFIDRKENPNAAQEQLDLLWEKFRLEKVEDLLGYRFKHRAFLLQALTHASYYRNRVTGCYQRLEFLGDAVIDYLVTRFLFEHSDQYSPGVLTDLRSALVNNTIFASLAVKHDLHKHFIAICPGLHHMIGKFVELCREKQEAGNFNAEMYMVTTEDEIDEGEEEDVEVPKALGDIFESLAGAVYLDSGRRLDVVWRVLYLLMESTILDCCTNPPRSPIRELMEREPDRVRFSKMERIIEQGKVRVTVEIAARRGGANMRFTGMGRNYRIAKTTAAKRALKYLRSLDVEKERAQAKELQLQQAASEAAAVKS